MSGGAVPPSGRRIMIAKPYRRLWEVVDSRVKFCQGASLAARIVAVVRSEEGPYDKLEDVLNRVPACRRIYDEIRAAGTDRERSRLERRLRTALTKAESTDPDAIEELERLLFKSVSFEQ